MIRTYGAASSGITSGVGFAITKTIATSFILPRDSGWMIPGPERPTKMSMPSITSSGAPWISSGFVVLALGRERALAVAADDLGDPGGEHHLAHRYPGGAEAYHQDPQLLDRFAGDLQGVEESRHRHHGGSVLVVVEDGDVEGLLEPVLDLEAARGGDVLEVDAAEGRRHQFDRADDLVGVLGVE